MFFLIYGMCYKMTPTAVCKNPLRLPNIHII
jgi:hypothetical protein